MHNRLKLGFKYLIEVVRPDGTVDESQSETVENLMPTQGLDHTLSVLLKGSGQISTWYIGLFSGNYTPQATDTMAAFVAAATEITSSYDEATREEFVEGTVSAGAVDNVTNEAEFTFNETKTVYGGFISSTSTKGSGSGVLLSAVRFGSPKPLADEGVLRVTAGFTMVSA